jgi:hypothetical protein
MTRAKSSIIWPRISHAAIPDPRLDAVDDILGC